jgi:hypothetical protein
MAFDSAASMTAPVPALTSGARHERFWLRCGSLFSGLAGLSVLFVPRQTLGRFSEIAGHSLIPPPTSIDWEIWLRLSGVFLLFTAFIYHATARDPDRYQANIAIMIVFKVISIVFYAWWVFAFGAARWWLLFAGADVFLVAVHVRYLDPPRMARICSGFVGAVPESSARRSR